MSARSFSAEYKRNPQPMQVGLLGLGTVAGGMIEVLRRNRAEIERRAGRGIDIVRTATRNPSKPRSFSTAGIPQPDGDAEALVRSPGIDIVVELIGGLEPARTLVLEAIRHGKHVVTANKALIAMHGNELFEEAHRRGVIVSFEAAVGGGIPIIKVLREGLVGNCIDSLAGIINGTCNFILSEMDLRGGNFDEALAEAGRLGYAEVDASFDIDGTDAAHKLAILSAIAFGIPLQFNRIYVEGISGICYDDIAYARELGYRIKHLGVARRRPGGIELRVHPAMIPIDHLLAGVQGVMNAVLLHGDAIGPTVYYGAGAGGEQTASAVIADLVDVTRTLSSRHGDRVPYLAFQPDSLRDIPILPIAEAETACYLRLRALDRPGVLAQVAGILGEMDISIEAVLQKEPMRGAQHVHVILLTQRVREGNMNRALDRIRGLSSISGDIVRIRVEPLN